jgi:DNA polymerase I
MMDTSLVYGKNPMERIVSIEVGDNTAEIFQQLEDGTVKSTTVPNSHYILFTEQHSPKFTRLKGNQPFKWLYETGSRSKYQDVLSACYRKGNEMHVIRDPKEALMIKDGYTYFKGMKTQDVSVLSFDIETNGLTHDKDSKVLLISNTLRKNGVVHRELFSLDDYPNQASMLIHWCEWVQRVNPSIIVGHNIFSFDLPYLSFVAKSWGTKLLLGRDGSELKFAKRASLFRKDGSQAYDYFNAYIYGREIVDTYFLSIKYDIGRNYESYGLKQIIKQEGLERPGRTHYDASRIKDDWNDEAKRKVIKAYAVDDADDALKLYDLMIPSFFYYTQSIPRSFQQIINTATGSQINSLMVRAYLQSGHSIARGSEAKKYPGAISFGIPGNHKNVLRFDVASLYPSVIRQFKIRPVDKDPDNLFLLIVDFFTLERLNNKRLGKETNDRYYKDLEQSQKIAINSMYGFLGAPKLNYNYPNGADAVTRYGRETLQKGIKIITGKEYEPEEESNENEDL